MKCFTFYNFIRFYDILKSDNRFVDIIIMETKSSYN